MKKFIYSRIKCGARPRSLGVTSKEFWGALAGGGVAAAGKSKHKLNSVEFVESLVAFRSRRKRADDA